METRSAHPSRRRVFAAMLVAPLALAACGGGDDGDNAASAPPTSAGASPTAASSSSTSPTTDAIVATTTSPTTTPPATTTPATTPATTEPCGSQCPLADDQQAAVDEFFAAYNGDDWEAFRNILVEEEVSWEFTLVIAQNEELMRYDFVWSAGLDEMWTPERCSTSTASSVARS